MTKVETIYIEEGYSFTKETTVIIPGVTLIVCNGNEGTLEIGDGIIEFDFTEEAKQLFENIDTHCEIIELLAILTTFTPPNYK